MPREGGLAGPPRRTGAATTLAAVMVSASLMQFALGALGPFFIAEFGLSRSGLGLLTASYYLAAAGLSPVMGRWVGRIGGTHGMWLAALLGAAGTALTGAAGNLGWLVAGVFVAGAAAAAANPATNLRISAMDRPHAVLIGVKQSGVQAAAFLTGAALPVIALDANWRVALWCCSSGCLLTVLTVIFRSGPRGRPSDPDADTDGPDPEEEPSPGAGTDTRRLPLYAALMGAGAASINTYLVLYAHEVVGLDVRLAGAQLALVGLVAVGARIVWPMLVERRPHPASAGVNSLRCIALAATASVGVIALADLAGPAVLWAGAVLAGLSSAAWNGLAMLVVVRVSPILAVAQSSARVQGAFFLGLMLSPLVFGALTDHLGGYGYGWLWTACCFLAAAPALHRPRPATRTPGPSPRARQAP